MANKRIDSYFVEPDVSVRKILEKISENKDGIVLVVDEAGKLMGTITDGDVRRFLLKDGALDAPCSELMAKDFVTAKHDASAEDVTLLMEKFRLRHVPLVDDKGVVCGLADMRDFISKDKGVAGATVVIMAGGLGTRLRPLTEEVPKPMLEVGGKPILETILERMVAAGIRDVFLAVNYKAEIIEGYFGDGKKFGLSISYLREDQRLGTGGALKLLPQYINNPVMVVNGDVVTDVDYSMMLDFHRQHHAVVSVAASEYRLNIPFGVFDLAGHFVVGVKEKPSETVYCNAGIYIVEKEMIHFIPENTKFDMTQLLEIAINKGLPVSAFPIIEYWVDIGESAALEKARDIMSGETK
ncbi:nucleotidyltransferase family protein [Verrucomicrobiota bacterium]